MTATVSDRQNVFDVALQYFGDVSASVIVAEKLNVAVTGKLTIGATFEYSESEIVNKQVVDYYQQNNITPTTDDNQ